VEQEAFDGAAAWSSVTDQARWKDTRVVHDDQIAGLQMFGHARKRGVLDRTRVSRKHQKARLSSLRRRPLRDQLVGEIEIKVARPQ
jgi:hypothetical protein